MIPSNSVGFLRQQVALCSSRERVIIVTADKELRSLDLRVVRCYPDIVNENGEWEPTFKIEIVRRSR